MKPEKQDGIDPQENLQPVHSHRPWEEWLVWVIAGVVLFYALVVGVGLTVTAVNGSRTEWAFPLMSVPCFVTAGWYIYAYCAARQGRSDGGLLFSGIGWAAVGVAFLFRNLSQTVSMGSSVLAMVCIVGGAVVSLIGRRQMAAVPQVPHQPVSPSSSPPPEQKPE